MKLERNAIPFFEQRETSAAIKALSGSRSLVIYCGAGVTIDRTGKSWAGLIGGLLPTRLSSDGLPMTRGQAGEVLEVIRPEELAIALAFYGTFIGNKIRIVTSNYDTYLEEAFAEFRDYWESAPRSVCRCPD